MKRKIDELAFDALQTLSSARSLFKRADPIKLTEKIPNPKIRNRVLDLVMSYNVPFNRWLGLHIDEIADNHVVITSPPTRLRQNHVGGTHACCLALMSEYAAGMCIANHYGIEEHRLIIGKLEIDYHKQGKGKLRSEAKAPAEWPELTNGEVWIDMVTEVRDEKNDLISVCKTKWQLKDWSQVGKKKQSEKID
jgi:acyl-coenzyme A thioesterase PaaI-like protein